MTTRLDQAHAAMLAAPEDNQARLQFYERLADAELFLMLEAEPDGDNITPAVFETGDGTFVLVFDREDRLAQFAGQVVPYAALSGRVVAGLLAPQQIGLGLNLDVAPSSILVPPSALVWLADTLDNAPDAHETQLTEVLAPAGLPQILLTALDAKLATAAGLSPLAYLVATRSSEGAHGHLLGFVDAVPGAESALAKAVGEALTFSGVEAGVLDVGFFASSHPMTARLARVGLRFDLPEPPADRSAQTPSVPGADPTKPPILR